MTIRITRWAPETCPCIIETQVDDSIPGSPVTFLLMNTICAFHQVITPTLTAAMELSNKSKNVLDLIERTKTRNIDNSMRAIADIRQAKTKGLISSFLANRTERDLLKNHQEIVQHNKNITEEWQELVTRPQAFASNIYDIVNEENTRLSNAVQLSIDALPADLSQTGVSGGTFKKGISVIFTYSGTAPNRILTVTFTGITLASGKRNTIQNGLNTRFGVGKVVLG